MPPLLGRLCCRVGQTQIRQLRWQALHRGFTASHFFFRDLHAKHPAVGCMTNVCVYCRQLGLQPKAPKAGLSHSGKDDVASTSKSQLRKDARLQNDCHRTQLVDFTPSKIPLFPRTTLIGLYQLCYLGRGATMRTSVLGYVVDP